MNRTRLNQALQMIMDGAGWYSGGDSFMEGAMHELTHAVVAGRGSICRNFEDRISVHDGWANRHEIAVMATQLAAFRKLGYHQGIRGAARAVAASVNTGNTRIKRWDTVASCQRQILAYKPNAKYVAAIVRAVQNAEKALAR
jgi:hypothetical protein